MLLGPPTSRRPATAPVPGSTAEWSGSGAAPATAYYANDAGTPGGCGEVDLTGAQPSGDNYYNNRLWTTHNLSGKGDTFFLDWCCRATPIEAAAWV